MGYKDTENKNEDLIWENLFVQNVYAYNNLQMSNQACGDWKASAYAGNVQALAFYNKYCQKTLAIGGIH